MTEATAEDKAAAAVPDPDYRERYPWHDEVWARLVRDLARLPHALLLHGPAGLGKRAFAWRLVQSLLCRTPRQGAQACDTCASCLRLQAGTHPDLLAVNPLEDGTAITVEQIRAVRDFVALTPHTSARKLIIVEPAEAMNLNAANALLKVLEEPPPGSSLILVTPQVARLPATIRSRCAAVAFRCPEERTAAQWLQTQGIAEPTAALTLAAGAPLLALRLAKSSDLKDHAQLLRDVEALRAGAEDPLRCAARWKNYGIPRSLAWFQTYLAGLIRASIDGKKNDYNVKELFRYFDVVSEAKALATGPLDGALLLEDLLIGWARISRSVG